MTAAESARAPIKFCVAIEAGSEASPVLEAAEHALDDVALLVIGAVVVVVDFAVAARRDDGLGTAVVEPPAQLLAVITLSATSSPEGGRASMQFFATLQSWTLPGVSRRT
jgi:hypothetical protein